MVISVNALGETEILMGYSLFSCRKSSQKAGTTDFFSQHRDTGFLMNLFVLVCTVSQMIGNFRRVKFYKLCKYVLENWEREFMGTIIVVHSSGHS